ncbi:putative efflux transporter [Dendrothele bispora CBS 962.96]|uniref:Putative efflux transporter n=1 Tax=Dendrothele bispora (strain CBS 962.96) TaxID=1314807 RepID=A0A4V6T5H9_DENBC|nr:putative efflux transporter [Dendrothele bispora CBS 962.96]
MSSRHPHYKRKTPEDVQVDVIQLDEFDDVRESRQEKSTFRSVLLVATCTIALMAHTSNNIAISITLPIIQRALNVPQVQLQWVVSAYALSSGCLLLIFGRLADLYGRKRVFLFGSIWLTAFTVGCAFAKDSLTLDILRGFQGIGSAATIPAAIGTLAATFPPSRARTVAFATFSAGSPLGSTLGVVVGGVLNQVTSATWKASFYLNAVLASTSVLGAFYSFERDKPSRESDRRVDWIGAFMVTAGLVLIVFVLGEGEVAPQKWATPYIIGLLITGVLLTLMFGFWQHYLEQVQDGLRVPIRLLPSPPPLMRLSLWKRSKGRVTVVMIIAFLNWASFVGWNFWTILYYENFSALTPIATVLRLLPQFIMAIFCNVFVARFVGRVPLVILIAAGTGLSGIASLLFAIIDPNAPYWAYGFPSAILSVFGANFVYPSGTLFIATVCAPFEQSVGGAVFQELTQLGSSAGVAVSTVVFNRILQKAAADRDLVVTNSRGSNLPQEVQLEAYRAAEWSNFAFAILGWYPAIVRIF